MVVEGKAAQSAVVGRLVHATDQLDKMSDKLRFLEQERRPKIGGPSRLLSTSRVSQQGKSPTFSADAAVAGIFAQQPVTECGPHQEPRRVWTGPSLLALSVQFSLVNRKQEQ